MLPDLIRQHEVFALQKIILNVCRRIKFLSSFRNKGVHDSTPERFAKFQHLILINVGLTILEHLDKEQSLLVCDK